MNHEIEMQNTKTTTHPFGESAQHTDTPPHPCIFSVLGDTIQQERMCTGGYQYRISFMEIQNKNIHGGAVVE